MIQNKAYATPNNCVSDCTSPPTVESTSRTETNDVGVVVELEVVDVDEDEDEDEADKSVKSPAVFSSSNTGLGASMAACVVGRVIAEPLTPSCMLEDANDLVGIGVGVSFV